jgi:hypothetical protein
LLGRIVLDHEQSLSARGGVLANACDGLFKPLSRGWFGHERERSMGKAMMPVLVEREHLYRDMASGRILLEVIQHCPTQHVRKRYIE